MCLQYLQIFTDIDPLRDGFCLAQLQPLDTSGIPSSRLQQHGLCGTGQNFHVDPALKNCQIVRIYENMIEYGCYLNDLELSTSPIQQDT